MAGRKPQASPIRAWPWRQQIACLQAITAAMVVIAFPAFAAPVFAPASVPLPGVAFSSVACGDFNDDGKSDVLLTGADASFNGICQIWQNGSPGTFTKLNASFPGLSSSAVARGDFDNDGRLDLLLTGFAGVDANNSPIYLSQIWRNLGSGIFTNIQAGLPGVNTGAVALGDYDNDGNLDVLLTGYSSTGAVAQVWRNLGNGRFTNINAGLPGVFYSSVAWGDYDNDGLLDILLTGTSNGFGNTAVTQLWRNLGNGTFTKISINLPGVLMGAVAWGDFDRDGRLDLLLTGNTSTGAVSQVWRNLGNGTFANLNVGLPGVHQSSVALADYDNDGALDIVLAGTSTQTNLICQVWRNTGSGVFTNLNAGLPGFRSGSVAWADLDSDGRLDLLLTGLDGGGSPVSSVYRNKTQAAAYIVKLPLPLTINGNGTLVGPTNGQLLELGKSYTLKATAKPGNVFSNWLVNGVAVTDATLRFNMVSNLSVVATFVTNSFTALKGTYTGLFYPNTPEPPHEESGCFTLTVTGKGAFTGKLLIEGRRHSFKGLLHLSLACSRTILRKGTNAIVVGIQMNAGSDQVSGYVSKASWNSDLFGHRATFNARQNPASNQSGKYTMLLSGGDDETVSPAGQSPAILDVTTAGAVTLKGTLADGTPVVQRSTLAMNGQTPIFATLYKGKGSLIGWLTMMNTDTNDTPGLLLWTKKEMAGGKIYFGGFTNEALALGSRYVVPATGSASLAWSNGVARLEQGNLSAAMTNNVTLSSANKITVTSTNASGLAFSLKNSSGLISGSFLHPDTLKKSVIKGVILQKQQIGGGIFLGTNHSGAVFLGETLNGTRH